MDIVSALDSTEPTRRPGAEHRCKIGRFIDSIPDDTPGKADLIATLEERDPGSPHWRPGHKLDALLLSLGVKTSNKTIGDHRARRCRCWV